MCQTDLGVLPLDGEEGVVTQKVPPATHSIQTHGHHQSTQKGHPAIYMTTRCDDSQILSRGI